MFNATYCMTVGQVRCIVADGQQKTDKQWSKKGRRRGQGKRNVCVSARAHVCVCVLEAGWIRNRDAQCF